VSASLFHTIIHPQTFKECVILGKKHSDHGTGIPRHEVEALARLLLPDIRAFYESEEGKREFAEWKSRQKVKKQAK
jgi:hypothetical protein